MGRDAEFTGRVLVVDDDEGTLRAYARILRHQGHSVDTAEDGPQAAQLLSKHAYDVVVSDIMMPGMDGIQFLRLVRERNLDLPVILVTANPALETAAKAVELGALRYLVKPVEMDDLTGAVGNALRVYQMARLRREAYAYLQTVGYPIGDRAGLEAHFDSALEQLWVAYQPIVQWPSRQLYAYEALLRSAVPELPGPPAVLDAAERLSRTDDLGRRVRALVATAVAQAPEGVLLFVNLHPRDLADADLVNPSAPLSRHAGRVVVEITERASLDSVPDVRERVAALRGMGYRVALDDLGAGYAGLSSFAHLSPDVVKLDMTLVRDVHHEPVKQKLVRSMVGVCREMGVLVVVEGVETPEERDVLADLGCDLFQGYLFARPGRAFPAATF